MILGLFEVKSFAISAIQDAAIDALMEFVREEKQGDFSNRIYSKICSSLVNFQLFFILSQISTK